MDFDITQPVDSIDKVPEQFRPLYAQGGDGKFVVDEKFRGVQGAIAGLNTANKAARTEAATYKSKVVDLSPLAEFGTDPVSIKAAFDQRVTELTAKGGDKATAVEQVRREMAAANAAAVQAEKTRSEAYRGQLHTILVKNEALSALAEAKGIPELLMPFIENQVRVNEADGQFAVQVLDGKGEVRYSLTTGQPMTIKELVATMKADAKYGRLFESTVQQNNGGGGMPPGNGSRRPAPQQGEKSANDKISAGLKNLTGRFPQR